MLTSFKEKLNAPSQSKTASILPTKLFCHFLTSVTISVDQSTTPPGSPPSDLQKSLGLQPTVSASAPATAPRNTTSILEALANMARQNTSAPPANPTPLPQASSYNISSAQNNVAQQASALPPNLPFLAFPPPVNVPAAVTFAPQSQGSTNGAQNFASNQTNPFAAAQSVAQPVAPPAGLDPQQWILIKALADQGLTPDKIAGVISQMAIQGQGPPMLGAGGIPPPPQFAAQNQNHNAQNSWGARPEESRDRNGYHEAVRSPPGQHRRRSRSRSPARAWNARDSPASRRRDEQNFDYERDSPGRNRGDDRGRGRGRGNDYRQRSPPRRGRSPSPPPRANGGGNKWVDYDNSIGSGKIKGNDKIRACIQHKY